MTPECSRQIFEKYSNIKFHENPSSRNRAVPCGWMDGRTDITKLIIAFRNFAKTPKEKGTIFRIHGQNNLSLHIQFSLFTRGADKSLARPGRKQARKPVRDAHDSNIETRAVIKFFFFPAGQGAEGN